MRSSTPPTMGTLFRAITRMLGFAPTSRMEVSRRARAFAPAASLRSVASLLPSLAVLTKLEPECRYLFNDQKIATIMLSYNPLFVLVYGYVLVVTDLFDICLTLSPYDECRFSV